ncbi:MAG TPA: hypothetical protein VG738_18040 [Chitinophagaceae bacterium]|nr:hypothetical protein [Chitinophagaceae bacterium]
MKNLIPAALLLTVALFSCKKGQVKPAPPGVPGANMFLYAGGYAKGGGGYDSIGIYFKQKLSDGAKGAAVNPVAVQNSRWIMSIVSYDSAMYMTGNAPGYWKNDSFIAVNNAWQLQYLAVNGNGVYTCGTESSGQIAYWQNNSEVNLGNTYNRTVFRYQGFLSTTVTGMALQGNNVLISGGINFTDEPMSGAPANDSRAGVYEILWTNSTANFLAHNNYWEAEAFFPHPLGVAVAGNDIYVPGNLPDSAKYGGYWQNGTWSTINKGNFTPTSAYANGMDVYFTGYTGISGAVNSPPSYAVYWKNGVLHYLNGLVTNAVTVYNGDVYVLGVDNSGNNVIWKNDNLFATLGPAADYNISCIATGY